MFNSHLMLIGSFETPRMVNAESKVVPAKYSIVPSSLMLSFFGMTISTDGVYIILEDFFLLAKAALTEYSDWSISNLPFNCLCLVSTAPIK